MANYGDVALNLSPSWDRRKERDKTFALRIVGHDNGKSDVARKDDPEKRHQFAWIDPRYGDELAANLYNGFDYVTRDLWDINEKLWGWNAEGKCLNGPLNQLLMARPAALYFAQKAEIDREIGSRQDKEGEAGDEIAARAGLKVERVEDEPRRARR